MSTVATTTTSPVAFFSARIRRSISTSLAGSITFAKSLTGLVNSGSVAEPGPDWVREVLLGAIRLTIATAISAVRMTRGQVISGSTDRRSRRCARLRGAPRRIPSRSCRARAVRRAPSVEMPSSRATFVTSPRNGGTPAATRGRHLWRSPAAWNVSLAQMQHVAARLHFARAAQFLFGNDELCEHVRPHSAAARRHDLVELEREGIERARQRLALDDEQRHVKAECVPFSIHGRRNDRDRQVSNSTTAHVCASPPKDATILRRSPKISRSCTASVSMLMIAF